MKKKPKLFKIMFSDISEAKQKEYLKLSKLKREEVSSLFPIAKIWIDPDNFTTPEDFFKSIRKM